MVNKKLIVIVIFREFDIIKKCLDSILLNDNKDFDVFIVENPSHNTEIIESYVKNLDVKKYVRFEDNTWGMTFQIVNNEFKDFIKKYDIITYTDGDLFFNNFSKTYDEILHNLNKKNVLVSSVDLNTDNLPKNVKGSENWVLKGVVENGYNKKCTGMHMVTFKKENINILFDGRVTDTIICTKVKKNNKLWVSTITNKATHLTWNLYKIETDYYHYKKTKIKNGLIQNINNNNRYKIIC